LRKFTDKELELAPKVAEVMGIASQFNPLTKGIFQPIPTIEDCLEWLREKFEVFELAYDGNASKSKWVVGVWTSSDEYFEGDTSLEALYRVILFSGKEGEDNDAGR